MMIASVGVTSLLFGTIMCMMVEVEGSWAWEWDRDNYPPINRYSRSKAPHAGVRRSIFERFLGDSSPNNPFLFSIPSIPRILPRLSENDFVNDDDYQEDRSDFHWFPQRHHSSQPTKSLEGLEHILEGKLGPINDPSPITHRKSSQVPSHKEEKEKKQKNKERKHRQRINHEMNDDMMSPSPSSSSSSSPSDERTGNLRHHFPNFGTGSFANEEEILNHDHFSKDILHDFQEELSMPEHFTNPKQFPKDFISSEQFPREFGLAEPSARDHLTTDPFASELEGSHGSFQDHLLLNPLPNSDFHNPDHIINLDTEVDLPQMFPNLGILGEMSKPEGFIPQERLAHFGLPISKTPDSSEIPDIIPERGEGLAWLPPSLSDLNLPLHGHMFSKEAHRGTRTIRSSPSVSGPDACHARNLHSCGSRLIDEFAFRPENSDKCRIREEFLDCMEKVMKLPCELHGERYSREGTKLIRDKIKTLLWSAQGCILGYSA